MTTEEIKQALRERLPIIHRDKTHQTVIVYAYAQAWRVTLDKHGRFISSLELVTGGGIRSMTVAAAEECEILKGDENIMKSIKIQTGIKVDKQELIKALQYERAQYQKGYVDGIRENVVYCKDCIYYRESKVLAPIKFCFRLKDRDGKPVGYNFSEYDFCSRGIKGGCSDGNTEVPQQED